MLNAIASGSKENRADIKKVLSVLPELLTTDLCLTVSHRKFCSQKVFFYL